MTIPRILLQVISLTILISIATSSAFTRWALGFIPFFKKINFSTAFDNAIDNAIEKPVKTK